MAIYHIVSVETKQIVNHNLEWKKVFERQLNSPVGTDLSQIIMSLHRLYSDLSHRVVIKEFYPNE